MYRYSVDQAVTYTSEDIVLFRESPFACWMERLTLENPDHGIQPDAYSPPPAGYAQRQDEFAVTLRDEGKNVALVDWDAEESVRRSATLDAMRRGTDFIVNGQLALGPLSGTANLLMRTSGFSELGNYLYIPCDTQAKTTLNSAFRLCFIADLLHSLQGQLPPQMLIIRGDAELLPLASEDHIYHYRAVKQRFMRAMSDFRKHRMPDPAASSHFGRWSDCAHVVLKQRALREEQVPVAEQEVAPPDEMTVFDTAPQATGGAVQTQPRISARGIQVGDTLVAQARQLRTTSFRESDRAAPEQTDSGLGSALENLEFIGSSARSPSIGEPRARLRPAPPKPRFELQEPAVESPQPLPERPAPVVPMPPSVKEEDVVPAAAASLATPAPTLNTDSREFDVDCIDDSDYSLPAETAPAAVAPPPVTGATPAWEEGTSDLVKLTRPFSSSLNTSNFPEEVH